MALIRTFAKLLQARYFEYLLTRFTEPNEIFGPVDIAAFREGRYMRRTENMLPESEVVFLDEVFKSNSAILNALLTLLNERRYTSGGQVLRCPLLSCFGASNEVPNDENLTAVFDRFLLRIRSDNLDAYHFQDLLQKGIMNEVMGMADAPVAPLASAQEILQLHKAFAQRMRFTEEFFSQYKGLVFQIRAEGVSLSDRRVVKILKLFAASAFIDGRAQPDASDFFVLKHIWNNEDQSAILEAIVAPVLEAHYRDHPNARRVGAVGVGIDALAGGDRPSAAGAHRRRRARRRAALQPAQGAERDQGRPRGVAGSARSRARAPRQSAPRGGVSQRPLRPTLSTPRGARRSGDDMRRDRRRGVS